MGASIIRDRNLFSDFSVVLNSCCLGFSGVNSNFSSTFSRSPVFMLLSFYSVFQLFLLINILLQIKLKFYFQQQREDFISIKSCGIKFKFIFFHIHGIHILFLNDIGWIICLINPLITIYYQLQGIDLILAILIILIKQISSLRNQPMKQHSLAAYCHQLYPYYTLQKRVMVKDTGLFKIKKFDEDHIIFSAPQMKQVVKTDLQLNKVVETYNYQDNPSAIDVVELSGHKFVIAGCHTGNIIVKPGKEPRLQPNQQGDDQLQEKGEYEWKYKPNQGQNYANDIVHLPSNQNIIINCYNNGNIAVWGLLSNKRLHTFQKAHHKYTYKLRIQSQSILVSCGNDCSIVRTDLESQKYLQSLNHAMPVWCAHPIDENQIASVGLFGRTLVWDVRCNRVVQFCNNDGNQSSFVTTRNSRQLKLFYGDANMIIKWDRRKSKPQLLTNHMMQVSAQALLFNDDRLYVCGRGKDLSVLKGSNTNETLTHFTQTQLTHVLVLSKNKKDNQFYAIKGHEPIEPEDENEESWSGSDNQMEDQSEPLIKQQQVYQSKPIEAVANITIKDLKDMKQNEQNWLICQQQDSVDEEQLDCLKKMQNNKQYSQLVEEQNQQTHTSHNTSKTMQLSSQPSSGKKQTKLQTSDQIQKQDKDKDKKSD